MTQRIEYIDRLKGFAILIVVLAHVYLISFDMGDSLVFKCCSSFEMPLFMFLSGYVAYFGISNKARADIKYKLIKRFFRYVCPAFVLGWFLSLYSYLILGNHNINFIDALISGQWYLKVLSIFVLIQAILLKCKNKCIEVFIIILAEALFLIGWKTCPILYKLMCLEHCFFFYPFFAIGYYAREYHLIDLLKTKNWIFTLSLIIYTCLLFFNIKIHALQTLSERLIIPLSAIIVIVYLFSVRGDKKSNVEDFLCFIGKNTLDIYIYHGIFIFGTFSCIDMTFIKSNKIIYNNLFIHLPLALLLTLILIFISIMIGKILRKCNFIRNVMYGEFPNSVIERISK